MLEKGLYLPDAFQTCVCVNSLHLLGFPPEKGVPRGNICASHGRKCENPTLVNPPGRRAGACALPGRGPWSGQERSALTGSPRSHREGRIWLCGGARPAESLNSCRWVCSARPAKRWTARPAVGRPVRESIPGTNLAEQLSTREEAARQTKPPFLLEVFYIYTILTQVCSICGEGESCYFQRHFLSLTRTLGESKKLLLQAKVK